MLGGNPGAASATRSVSLEEEVSYGMAGSRRRKTRYSADSKSETVGPIRLEDIPWAEIIIDSGAGSEPQERCSEVATQGPDILVPADQVPLLGEELGQRSLPLLPVLVLALAMLCLLALGTGVTSDF
jgi:hypothetical protein